MSDGRRVAAYVRHGAYAYPIRHWDELRRFALGDDRDPRGLFRLADDTWEAWPYAPGGRPSIASDYRLKFGGLCSFLKLYVKWFCYQRLLGSMGNPWHKFSINHAYSLRRAEQFIVERGYTSIDDIAPQAVFEELWDALIIPQADEGQTGRPQSAVINQMKSRSFWGRLSTHFGVPHVVPPTAPYTRKGPTEYADDRRKIIPEHVIKQVVNKLALHRHGIESLNRFDHLRLCVLVLGICLGRRFGELVSSPRGVGPDGPLSRVPARGSQGGGALWFHFKPNKGGPAGQVFISAEWEDVATYCVRELARYSDEIRANAAPEEQDQLILASSANLTWGPSAAYAHTKGTITSTLAGSAVSADAQVKALRYTPFDAWLNGTRGKEAYRGALQVWGITEDGTPGGAPYELKLSYFRHTRQSALALDPRISFHALQKDLNHNDPRAQFAYQHRLAENHDLLLRKIKEGMLCGGGAEWLGELLGVDTPGFSAGSPSTMTPRWRALVRHNPLFMQLNRVPGGLCALPQGPGGCPEFLNCTGAAEGGCPCFIIDSDDAAMLSELDSMAREQRRRQLESAAAGRVVQAGKREAQARRTEELRDEALRRASAETIDELRRLQSEVDEEGVWGDE